MWVEFLAWYIWTCFSGEEEEAPQEEATEASLRESLIPQCHTGMNVAGQIPGPRWK